MQVTTSVIIDQPIRKVFAYISTPRCWPDWMTGVSAIESRSARSLEVRETFDRVDHVADRRQRSTWEVTELEPPRLVGCRRIGGGVPAFIRQVLESVDGCTRLTLCSDGEVSDRLADGPGVERAMARQLEHVLGGLKQTLERRDLGDSSIGSISSRLDPDNVRRTR